MNWWRRLRAAFRGREQCVVVFNPPTDIAAIPRLRAWTGEHSLTAQDILHHLQYGPMTRRQLDELLDVQTACIHLPKLIERGLVRKIARSRPAKYELTR